MYEKHRALRSGESIHFWGNDKPKCPHCGHDYNIEDHDAWDLYAEETHRVECDVCQLEFSVRSIATWTFSTDEQEDDEPEEPDPDYLREEQIERNRLIADEGPIE